MATTETDAAVLGIAYLGVKDIYSADNSSPQTTEINAKHRAPTLMKWVNIAAVESAFIVLLLMGTAPRGHKKYPFIGGVLALIVTYGQYIYAKACGLNSIEEATEDFKQPQQGRSSGGRSR